jgi:hypothetical protein
MEIPPSSSIAQSTAFFSGLSRTDVENSILSIGPEPERNSHLHSTNMKVAASMTGELQDFKYEDYKEAYRLMNGPPKYPFQSIAQISNSKFDPYYFDGSENDPNFNVNENLIGTPLGTSVLEDPRLSYVKNIMTLKEYQGRADQLNDTYLKELYMVNSEKGSNYYINMLERQQQALEYWSREGRASKNKTIPGIAFTYNLPAGETQRSKKRMKLNQTIYSETPSVQRNYRRQVMSRLPSDPNDTVNRIGITDDQDYNVISLGSNIIPNPGQPFQVTGGVGNGLNQVPFSMTPLKDTKSSGTLFTTPEIQLADTYRNIRSPISAEALTARAGNLRKADPLAVKGENTPTKYKLPEFVKKGQVNLTPELLANALKKTQKVKPGNDTANVTSSVPEIFDPMKPSDVASRIKNMNQYYKGEIEHNKKWKVEKNLVNRHGIDKANMLNYDRRGNPVR